MVIVGETFLANVNAIVTICLSLASLPQSCASADSCGETFSTRKNRNVFSKYRFRSRVIESHPISRPLECYTKCMKNCRCASYNICNGGKQCELNSEKKNNNVSLFEQSDECDYHEYEFSKQSHSGDCLDACCLTSIDTCLYGGRCQAICMKNNKRFHCECPDGYSGERCEIVPRSCAAYAQSSNKTAGVRIVHASDDSTFSVFCHFTAIFAMTLVMSFSRSKAQYTYKSYAVFDNFPRSEDKPDNWPDFRLSVAKMESIRNYGSTHWIFACSYPTQGLSERDYLRSSFSKTDILRYTPQGGAACTEKLEYVNIMGKSCENCAVDMSQSKGKIFFVNSANIDCGGLTGLSKPTCGSAAVTYFGRYWCYMSAHKCSSSDGATTQLWFAKKTG